MCFYDKILVNVAASHTQPHLPRFFVTTYYYNEFYHFTNS